MSLSCAAHQFLYRNDCSDCAECNPGTELVTPCSRDTDTVCAACPAGKYGMGGDASCITCERGSARSREGGASKQACLPCDAGTFPAMTLDSMHTNGITSGAVYCVACPPGQYGASRQGVAADGAGGDQVNGPIGCSSCVAGQFQPGFRQSSCLLCRAGKYATTSGVSACLACAAGRYSAAGGENCEECGVGKFADRGARNCEDCPAGQYQLDRGETSCVPCGAWCHEHGACSASGECACEDGFSGARCESDGADDDGSAAPVVVQGEGGPWAAVAGVLGLLLVAGAAFVCRALFCAKGDPLGIATSGFTSDNATVAAAATVVSGAPVKASVVTTAEVVTETTNNPVAGGQFTPPGSVGAGVPQSASSVLSAAVNRERQRQQDEGLAPPHQHQQAMQPPPQLY